jgi:ceramide glucosyltransferase
MTYLLLLIGVLLLCIGAIVYYGLAIYAAIAFFTQTRSLSPDCSPSPEFCPNVTILRPICGLDSNAYENLASFCRQDFPCYQIIFGIQSQADPSIAVVQQLIQDFPEIDIQFVVSDRVHGTNLKVSNLINADTQAKYDILLIADSDIWVDVDYLRRVVQPLSNATVGVVTCMYRSRTQGWISTFEALSISTEFLPSVLVAHQLEGMTFALGATIVIRRSVLEAIGGLVAVVDYLEDDFQLGHLAVQAGYQVALSDYVVDHVMATGTLADLLHHQTRWNRGIRFARPGGYLGLIFTYGTVSSALFLALTAGSFLGWAVFVGSWSIRCFLAWLVGVHYLQDRVAQNFFWLTPLRDLMSFSLWCHGFTSNTIEWRGRKLQLLKGGVLIDS